MQSTKQKNTPVLKYRRMKTNELTINRTSILISQAMHLLLVVEFEPIEHCLGHLTGLTTGTSNKKISTGLFPCPCCGNLTLSEINSFEICTVCCWEDGPIQSSNPNYAGGANHSNLVQAQSEWLKRAEKQV